MNSNISADVREAEYELLELVCLNEDESLSNCFEVDGFLRNVMSKRHSFSEQRLAAYLFYTQQFSVDLPSWQQLLNASIELTRMRGQYSFESLFRGMLPLQTTVKRNSGTKK